MAKRVLIDEDACIGCGTCVELCPDVFEMDDTEIAKVIKPAGEDDEDCVQEAIDSCPVSCISFE